MNYYTARLSGNRLRRCYTLAPARVQQYLDAEIAHVHGCLRPPERVLELGCGYGRVLARLADAGHQVVGVDTSLESLLAARAATAGPSHWLLAAMDASALGFRARSFDAVVCIQNGICAFRTDPEKLLREALRVLRPGGRAMFSSYHEAFWPHRLHWFELQAAEGLVGEIDYGATEPGVIVCKDGFRSATCSGDQFIQMCARIGIRPTITAVDESSVFCELIRPPDASTAIPGRR